MTPATPLSRLATFESRPDGALLVRALERLGAYPRCVSDVTAHRAAATPDSAMPAERAAPGAPWRRCRATLVVALYAAPAGSALVEP